MHIKDTMPTLRKARGIYVYKYRVWIDMISKRVPFLYMPTLPSPWLTEGCIYITRESRNYKEQLTSHPCMYVCNCG
jgi:hypothetical protein